MWKLIYVFIDNNIRLLSGGVNITINGLLIIHYSQ